MASRRHWHLSLVSAIAGAALLAACGGGDPAPTTTRVVSFGDSLSDLGTYTIATSQVPGVAPYFGGRFTTNTHTGYTTTTSPLSNLSTIWVEWVAARYGVPITQAMLGFATTRIPCPAAATPALAQSCTAYGQGGSRVTNPIGINNAEGALTDPLVTQVAAHLARFTNFSSSDVVFVFAGGNDALIQIDLVGRALQTPTTANTNMRTAGTELAALIRTRIVANGATRVAVLTLPDLSATPSGSSQPAGVRAVLAQLSVEFNSAVAAGLAGTDVRVIDAAGLFANIQASPTTYGFTNATITACDPARMAPATRGSALFCNAAAGQPFNSLRAGASATTWLFADGNHPTTGGHRAIADYVITQLKAYGWMAANQ